MIKAQDLRIGNWLRRNDGNIFMVEVITPDKVYEADTDGDIANEYNKVQGIKLNSFILELCGFTYSSRGYLTLNNPLINPPVYSFDWINETIFMSGSEFEYEEPAIKYLHELQNIYYILSRQELDINTHQLMSIPDNLLA